MLDSLRTRLALAAMLFAVSFSVGAPTHANPFDQGSVSISGGGSLRTGSGGETVFVVSLGGGYFVLDGLELGVSTAAFFGADPFIAQLSPGVRYVFWMVPVVHPYLGAFYRHWFVAQGFPDLDSVGSRAGILISSGPVLIGLGVVYERIVNPPCSDECDRIYPELGFSITF